jgi:single-strand DNA-binding protein
VNIVFLRGRLSSPAQQRVLDSGTVIVNYEVTVARDDGPADSVPVMWPDPPDAAAAAGRHRGAEVVVVGRVRRRFFRVGGATQSRTEVVADTVVPARQAKKAATLLARRVEEVIGAR